MAVQWEKLAYLPTRYLCQLVSMHLNNQNQFHLFVGSNASQSLLTWTLREKQAIEEQFRAHISLHIMPSFTSIYQSLRDPRLVHKSSHAVATFLAECIRGLHSLPTHEFNNNNLERKSEANLQDERGKLKKLAYEKHWKQIDHVYKL